MMLFYVVIVHYSHWNAVKFIYLGEWAYLRGINFPHMHQSKYVYLSEYIYK